MTSERARTPSWRELQELIRATPKPAMAGIAEQLLVGKLIRSATFDFDGDRGWRISGENQVEVTQGERTTLQTASGTETYEISTASNNWLKPMIDGRRLAYLDGARGNHILRGERLGRSVWSVEVSGLRLEDDAVFALEVDAATGVILFAKREDWGSVFRISRVTFLE
jgi:hypothetical protein